MAQAQVDLEPVRKWEVYILMHSHNDIGYTDIQPNIAKKQAHNVLRALELIQKTKDYPAGARFKWNLEVLMPYEDFHAIATPEQEKQFEQAVRDGYIGIDAMYANLLTGVCRCGRIVAAVHLCHRAGPPLRREGRFDDDQRRAGADLGRRAGTGAERREVHFRRPQRQPWSMDGDRIGYVRVQWEYQPFYWLSPSGRDKVLYLGRTGRLLVRPRLRVDHGGLAGPLPPPG